MICVRPVDLELVVVAVALLTLGEHIGGGGRQELVIVGVEATVDQRMQEVGHVDVDLFVIDRFALVIDAGVQICVEDEEKALFSLAVGQIDVIDVPHVALLFEETLSSELATCMPFFAT